MSVLDEALARANTYADSLFNMRRLLEQALDVLEDPDVSDYQRTRVSAVIREALEN